MLTNVIYSMLRPFDGDEFCWEMRKTSLNVM